jgi:hypothetical protein
MYALLVPEMPLLLLDATVSLQLDFAICNLAQLRMMNFMLPYSIEVHCNRVPQIDVLQFGSGSTSLCLTLISCLLLATFWTCLDLLS